MLFFGELKKTVQNDAYCPKCFCLFTILIKLSRAPKKKQQAGGSWCSKTKKIMWIPGSHQCHSSHLLSVAAFALTLSHLKWKGIRKRPIFDWKTTEAAGRRYYVHISKLRSTQSCHLKNFMMFIHTVARLTILMTKVADMKKKKKSLDWDFFFFFFLGTSWHT